MDNVLVDWSWGLVGEQREFLYRQVVVQLSVLRSMDTRYSIYTKYEYNYTVTYVRWLRA